jgi:peptide/nickel transport system substrate-binding protein
VEHNTRKPTPVKAGAWSIVIAALVLSACTPVQSGSAVPSSGTSNNDTVTLLVTTFGNELFDPFSGDSATQYFQRLMAAPLIEGDGTGAGLAPSVASSWEMSSDAKTWTFTIADGIKAQNGEEITAEDVWWNLDSRFGDIAKQRVKDGEIPDANVVAGLIPLVKKVTLEEPNKVVMELTQPRTDWAFRMSSNTADTGNIIIPADYFRKVGPDGYQKAPVGIGPFKLVSHTPGQEMVFERFDDYFLPDRLPKFKRLVVRVVPDAATRVAALQAGQADIIAANPLMVPDITAAGGSVAYAKEAAYPDIRYVDCWDTSSWCYPKQVRQALEYAVDKDAILSQLYGADAGAVKGWQWVTPSSLGYEAGVTDPYPYDLDKAKQLLADAGFPDGKGIPNVVINVWDGAVPFLPEVAEILKDSWAQLGIQSTVNVADEQALRDLYNNRKLSNQVLVRDNETRWNGLDVTTVQYIDPNFESRFCDPSSPTCVALDKIIREKMLPVYPNIETTNAAWQDVYAAIRDDDLAWSPFYLSQPWGLGPRIAGYQPWPLNPYNTAMWTIELK